MRFFCLILFLLFSYTGFAQLTPTYSYLERYTHPQKKNLSLDLGVGFNALNGNGCSITAVSDQRHFLNPNLSLGLGYQYTHYIELFLRGSYVNLYCESVTPVSGATHAVVSHNAEGVVGLKHYLFPMRDYDEYLRKYNAYALLGAGVMYLTPYNAESGERATGMMNGDRLAFVAPVGAGVSYRLNNFFSMSLEARYQFTNTDLLDGVDVAEATMSDGTDGYASFGVRIAYILQRSEYEYQEFLRLKNKPGVTED